MPAPAAQPDRTQSLVRNHEAAFTHQSFFANLVNRIHDGITGVATGDKFQRIAQGVKETAKKNDALAARFKLGESSDVYLMQTILPLASPGENANETLYPHGLYPEVESANRRAVVETLQTHAAQKRQQVNSTVGEAFQLVERLLELSEVMDFVRSRVYEMDDDLPAKEPMQKYVNDFSPRASTSLPKGDAKHVQCTLFNLMDELLDDGENSPWSAVRDQYEHTVLDGGKRVRSAIKRLASQAPDNKNFMQAVSRPTMTEDQAVGIVEGLSGLAKLPENGNGDSTAPVSFTSSTATANLAPNPSSSDPSTTDISTANTTALVFTSDELGGLNPYFGGLDGFRDDGFRDWEALEQVSEMIAPFLSALFIWGNEKIDELVFTANTRSGREVCLQDPNSSCFASTLGFYSRLAVAVPLELIPGVVLFFIERLRIGNDAVVEWRGGTAVGPQPLDRASRFQERVLFVLAGLLISLVAIPPVREVLLKKATEDLGEDRGKLVVSAMDDLQQAVMDIPPEFIEALGMGLRILINAYDLQTSQTRGRGDMIFNKLSQNEQALVQAIPAAMIILEMIDNVGTEKAWSGGYHLIGAIRILKSESSVGKDSTPLRSTWNQAMARGNTRALGLSLDTQTNIVQRYNRDVRAIKGHTSELTCGSDAASNPNPASSSGKEPMPPTPTPTPNSPDPSSPDPSSSDPSSSSSSNGTDTRAASPTATEFYCAWDLADDVDMDNALSAGLFAMCELSDDLRDYELQRSQDVAFHLSNLSPVWQAHSKPELATNTLLNRTRDGAWWGKLFQDANPPDFPGWTIWPPEEDAVHSTHYAIARGLCGTRGPFHLPPTPKPIDTDDSDKPVLVYNVVTSMMPPMKFFDEVIDRVDVLADTRRKSPSPKVKDFVELDRRELSNNSNEYHDYSKQVQWAPASIEKDPTPLNRVAYLSNRPRLLVPSLETPADLPQIQGANAASHVAVLEHLVDFYTREWNRAAKAAKTATNTNDADKAKNAKGAALARRAATKLEQLHATLTLFFCETKVCEEEGKGILFHDNDPDTTMLTRPCITCPDGTVLYPVDVGIAAVAKNSFESQKTKYASPCNGDDNFAMLNPGGDNPDNVPFIKGGENTVDTLTSLEATRGMRRAMQNPAGSEDSFPLYVPTTVGQTPVLIGTGPHVAHKECRDIYKSVDSLEHADRFTASNLRRIFKHAIATCDKLEQLECEERYLEEELKNNDKVSSATQQEQEAIDRREAIYNDALREAALSGDRLYAFAQMVSGIINEPVEAVAVIDDTAISKTQSDHRAQRQQTAQRVAEAHMSIVKSVFGAVLKDSNLTLGLGNNGSDLRVLNATLTKQAQELTDRPVSEGFFANSVKLHDLLAKGGGDIGLNELFQRLGGVARKLQESAESILPVQSGPTTTLDFLRAPRNSLFLQWRVETKAALRRAYDLFTVEMAHHYHFFTKIHAYELVEGVDSHLSNTFAEFVGNLLSLMRAQNPSNAMYLSNAAASVMGRKVGISLQRLVSAACQYRRRYGAPRFRGDRAEYFRNAW